MSELLQAKSEEFIDRLRNDLSKAEQRYKDILRDIEEYVFLRSFLIKETVKLNFFANLCEFRSSKEMKLIEKSWWILENRSTPEQQCKLFIFIEKLLFRKANSKILVRVQNDLFVEMPYARAQNFVTKRIDFLSQIAHEYLKEIAQIKVHITMTFAVMDPANLRK